MAGATSAPRRSAAQGAVMTVLQLDAREEHFRIPSHHRGRSLFLRHLPPSVAAIGSSSMCMAARFPSALSIAHRFDGRSWRDELCAAGFHVWALDFHGFGRLSDPYPEMARPAKRLRRSAAPRTPVGRWSWPPASSAGGTGSAALDYCPFVGNDRDRAVRRGLSRTGRSAGLLRSDRASDSRQASASSCPAGV